MKKIVFVLVVIFVFLISLPLFAQDDSAKIIFVKGKVELKLKDSNDFKKAKTGDLIKPGDVLRTDKNSSTEVAFDEKLGNIIKLDEYSMLSVKSFKPADVSIVKGRVFAIIDNLDKGSTFEIRTPQAVAGARGTGWSMAIGGNKTQVEAYDHTIYVSGLSKDGNKVGEIEVPAGFQTAINEFNPPSQLEKLSDSQMSAWNKLKSSVDAHRNLFLNPQKDASGQEDFEQLENKFTVMEEGREARFDSMHESRMEAIEERAGNISEIDDNDDAFHPNRG